MMMDNDFFCHPIHDRYVDRLRQQRVHLRFHELFISEDNP